MATLPTQLDPRALALMQSLQPGAAPAPTQAAAAPPSPTDPLMSQYQAASQRGEELAQRSIELGRQERAVPEALPWQPSFRPLHATGVTDPLTGQMIQQHSGVGNFLHDLLQGLALAGTATRPGMAVKSAIEAPRFAARAQEIAGIRAEQQPTEQAEQFEEKRAEAAGRLGYEQGMLGIRGRHEDIQQERVNAYASHMRDVAANYIRTANLREAATNERVRHDIVAEAQAKADEAGRDFRSLHKDATTEEVAQIVTGTRREIANEAAARDPGVKAWLFNALGIDVPQLQTAPSPEFRETPKAAKAPAKAEAAPARPPGVPATAKWDRKTRRWKE